MTERAFKTTTAKADSQDDDSDSISLNSTDASEGKEDGLYNVERILAEKKDREGINWYLIEWEGYRVELSTWEPESNIEEDRTLTEWMDQKMRITRGYAEAFNVEAWEKNVDEFEQAKERRKRRRREKRKRLGIPVSPSEPEDSAELFHLGANSNNSSSHEAQEVNDRPEDTPGHSHVRKRRRPFQKVNMATYVVDDEQDGSSEAGLPPIPQSPRRKEATEPKADIANLSEDSLIEDLNAKAAKRRKEVDGSGQKEKIRLKNNKKEKLKKGARASESPKSTTFAHQGQRDREPSPFGHSLSHVESGRIRTEAPSRTGYQGTANRQVAKQPTIRPPRGGTALRGRGGGAQRGGHTDAKPSFISTGAPLNQKRSLVNSLLEPKGNNSHFQTISTRRKAELAGRALADLAPDSASLKLVNPVEHLGFGKISKRSRPESHVELKNIDSAASSNKPIVTFLDNNHIPSSEERGEVQESNTRGRERENQKTALAERHLELAEKIQELSSSINSLPGDRPVAQSRLNMNSIPKRASAMPSHYTRSLRTTKFSLDQRISETNQSSHDPGISTSKPQQLDGKPKPGEISSNGGKHLKFSSVSDGVTFKATFGSSLSHCVSITLTGIDKNSEELWVHELQDLADISFDATCFSGDIEAQRARWPEQVAMGDVFSDDDGMSSLGQVAEQLRPLFCVVFTHSSFIMVLFPSKSEEWKFLGTSSVLSKDADLRYCIFGPNPILRNPSYESLTDLSISSIDLKRSHLDTLVAVHHGLDHRTLFSLKSDHKDYACCFLLFSHRSAATARLLEKWLRTCIPRLKIFTSQKAGSWGAFIEHPKETGVILIDETLMPSVFKIPWTFKIIQMTPPFAFWCVSDTTTVKPPYGPVTKEGKVREAGTAIPRLFPHGGAILLTPSFLMTEPERAFDLLNFVKNKGMTWKIVACHNLRQYLFELAMEAAEYSRDPHAGSHSDELDQDAETARIDLKRKDCESKFSNYLLVDSIMTNEKMAGYPYSWDTNSPDEFECPIIYADERIRQNDETRLIEWYAGWTMSRLDRFRKFIVVGTKPSTPTAKALLKMKDTPPIKDSLEATMEKSSSTVNRQVNEITSDTNLLKSTSTWSPVRTQHAPLSKKVTWSDMSETSAKPRTLDDPLKTKSSKRVSWSLDTNGDQAKLERPDHSILSLSNISSAAASTTLDAAKTLQEKSSGSIEMPSSMQQFSSTRPPVSNHPGDAPPEDTEAYMNPRIVKSVQQTEMNDEANLNQGYRKGIVGKSLLQSGREEHKKPMNITFEESTLDCYEKIKRNGGGWEHIMVTDGDKAVKILNIKPR